MMWIVTMNCYAIIASSILFFVMLNNGTTVVVSVQAAVVMHSTEEETETEAQHKQLRGSSDSAEAEATSSDRILLFFDYDDSNSNNNTTVDDDDDGISSGSGPSCLVTTVCSIPQLETLCGYISSPNTTYFDDDENDDDKNYTTTKIITTMFAPNNDAFDNIPVSVENDITANENILMNVLKYHTVVISGGNNDSSIVELPISVNELECDEELIMSNDETTETICFESSSTTSEESGENDDDDNTIKLQLGDGNIPLKSLPRILIGDIEACDGNTLVHIIDQLMIPALPLSRFDFDFDTDDGELPLSSRFDVDEDEEATATAATTEINDAGSDELVIVSLDVEDNNNNDCGSSSNGIIETVCSMTELEFLCNALQRLKNGENGDNDGIDFLNQSGIFFAATNEAFDKLPSLLATQLEQNSTTLADVIKYHAVKNKNGNDDGNEFAELELKCDEELIMMNDETTKTLCITNADGIQDKVQLGYSNIALRSLPKIINTTTATTTTSSDVDTKCNQNNNAIIHIVDHVIIPVLPSPSSLSPPINKQVETLPPQSSSLDDDNTNSSIGEEEEEEECGGIYETICSTPGLELLCDLLREMIEEEGAEDDFFLSDYSGTFFAPINEAIMNLPSSIALDLQDDTKILSNVLQYHAVMMKPTTSTMTTTQDRSRNINNNNNNTTTGIDIIGINAEGLLFVDELVCDEELLMMNNETTTTLCLNDPTDGTEYKVQLGHGNMPLRTLPRILSSPWIITCDLTSIIHLVDQVIVPGLPLTTADGESSSNDGDATKNDDGTTTNNDINDLDTITLDVCPLVPPDIANTGSAKCNNVGMRCGYGYVYTGCTWFDLRCTPTTDCVCSSNDDDDDGTTTGSSWSCTAIDILPCDGSVGDGSSIVAPEDLPWNEDCDPEFLPEPPRKDEVQPPLFPPPPVTEEAVVEEEDTTTSSSSSSALCPIDEPASAIDSCENIGAVCDYNHIYLGCTWEELECSPIVSCECFGGDGGGTWACLTFAMMPCGDDSLPWGDRCDPNNNEDLPQPPPTRQEDDNNNAVTTVVEGRVSMEECPETIRGYGDRCSETHASNLVCEYNHIWMGCTWEELRCSPIKICECDKLFDGNWACLSFAMIPCDEFTTPSDLPWGQYCDPLPPQLEAAVAAIAATEMTEQQP